MMQKTALIFGITGQDGSYLAELLLRKGYRVVGVSRRVSVDTTERLKSVVNLPNFRLMGGDVTDPFSTFRLVTDVDPDEVYNLAAQSHVRTSFDEPSHTWDVTAKGVLNCLEAIRLSTRPLHIRFYQASSSEMFGSSFTHTKTFKKQFDNGVIEAYLKGGEAALYDEHRYQDEDTPFAPNSPYAVAKLAGHNLVHVYRESYGLHASSGILFNHESERRGENFVTRKVSKHVARLALAKFMGEDGEKLMLGNVAARRDWGHAEDYVKAMWLMLQQEKPDDYVIATGETHSVQEFVTEAFKFADLVPAWETDQSLFRPCEVSYLRGDASKAKRVLGWEPEVRFVDLVQKMVLSDLASIVGLSQAFRILGVAGLSER